MRFVALAVVSLAGCAVDPPAEVGVERQAVNLPFPMSTPWVGGQQEALLGTSVALCRGLNGFVGGAPGTNSVLLVSDGGSSTQFFRAPNDGGLTGIAVACDDGYVLTAGDAGVFYFSTFSPPSLLTGAPASSISRPPSPSQPLLVGFPTQARVLLSVVGDAGLSPPVTLLGMSGFGAVVKWSETTNAFAVSNLQAATVSSYTLTSGGPSLLGVILGPMNVGFGTSLAYGDVHPSSGPELLIGAPGMSSVFIYSAMGTLLMKVDAPTGAMTFGQALTVEPGLAAGTLHAFWAGDPAQDRVFRFIGDAGTEFTGPDMSAFGSSMAMGEPGLIVGAPLYSQTATHQGGLFVRPANDPILFGTIGLCNVGSGCINASTCTVGTCVGGVFCQNPVSLNCALGCSAAGCLSLDGGIDAGAFDAGLVDAGSLDGGPVDAGRADAGTADGGDGPSRDAGAPDAGSASDAGSSKADAGTVDGGAGPNALVFTSCGCTGTDALPLLLLSLVLSRRRWVSSRR